MAKPAVMLVLLMLLAWPLAQAVRGDVLVLKSGAKFEGKVLDEGGRYVVVTATGSKLPFPKNLVAQVIRRALPKRNLAVERFVRELDRKSLLVKRALNDLDAALARAKARHAAERKQSDAPAALAAQHGRELGAYEAVRALAAGTEQAIAQAKKAARAAAEKPDAAEAPQTAQAAIAEWRKRVDASLAETRDALAKTSQKDPPPASAEPNRKPAPRGPDHVVLVVNTEAEHAGRIALNYLRARKVPRSNVVKVRVPVGAEIAREDYDRRILAPVQDYLKQHPQTTVILLVRGIPWRIPETGRSPDKRRYVGWDRASVDSELTLAKYGEYKIAGRLRNPLYNRAAELTPDLRILGVCRLDAPGDKAANELVGRAIRAEKLGVRGIAFFDARGLKSGDYLMGDRAILRAADIARRDGRFTVKVDTQGKVVDLSLMKEEIGFYYGWYAKHFKPKNPRFRFGRGAVAAHLHSYAGYKFTTKGYWLGQVIYYGATAAVGVADEPLLDGFPMPDPLIDALLKGRTFAEASLSASRYLSWMSLNVGDPLYRPFKPKPADPDADKTKDALRNAL